MKKTLVTGTAMFAMFMAACATSDEPWSEGNTVLITAEDLATTPRDGMLELDLEQDIIYVVDYSAPMDFSRVLLVHQDRSMTLERWLAVYRDLGFDDRDSKHRRVIISGKSARPVYKSRDCEGDCDGPQLIDIDNDIDILNDIGNDTQNDNNDGSQSESCSSVVGCIENLL